MIPLTGLISPLLALPVITAQLGTHAWVALAVGQSIGMAASSVGELGWGLNGPQRVARMAASNSYRLMLLSLQSKLVSVCALAGIVAALGFALTREYRIEAGLIAIASLAAALNAVWFFLGKSEPWLAILTDGIPRLVGVLLGAILVLLGAPLMAYVLIGLLLPCIVGPFLGLVVARARTTVRPRLYRLRHVLTAVFSQASAFTARLVSSVYIALPVTLVSIVSPASVPVFAAGERLMRLALGAMVAIPNSMQGWVGSSRGAIMRWQRVKKALLANVVLGVVAAVGFGLLAPFASDLMFSGTATISSELAWVLALVILVVSISRATGGIALVALRRVPVIMWSAICGAIVGVPAILLLSRGLGPIGGALGELIAESIVLAVQAGGIARMRGMFGGDRGRVVQ